MRYQILAYQPDTGNLGDTVQTIAMSRLLQGPLRGVYRHRMNTAVAGALFVVNGWLACPYLPDKGVDCLFAGVYVGHPTESLPLLKGWAGCRRVGARDPFTVRLLENEGIMAESIGCATMTFERYTGLRKGRFNYDGPSHMPGEKLTNSLSSHEFHHGTWSYLWDKALRQLEAIKTAEYVITRRLHVAVPALAFGTPVRFINDGQGATSFQPNRLSLWSEHLQMPFGVDVEMDISQHASHYLNWLARHLEREVVPHDPIMPVVDA